jgi:hypothetical protein
MNNLSFDEGYKEFTINNDENRVIRFNPSDYAIITRLAEAKKVIEDAIAKAGDVQIDAKGEAVDFEKTGEMVQMVDNVIREQVDYIFASKVSDKIFGSQSPMSNIGGEPLFVRVFNSIEPFILEATTQKRKESRKRVEKYTKGIK